MSEPATNLNQALLAAMETHANKICFKLKQGEGYRNIYYRRFQTMAFRLARFFQAQGITNGERVAIACENCLEWMLVHTATLLSGGVIVPMRVSSAFDTLQFMLHDSGARMVVLDDEHPIEKFAALIDADRNKLPELQTILTVKPTREAYPATTPITQVLSETATLTPDERDALRTHAANTPPETLVSIHYTAGETGRLKGAVFDHRRVLTSLVYLADWFPLDEDDVALTLEPWSYAPSLKCALHYFLSGVTNVLSEQNDQAVVEHMQQTSPTVTVNSPHFYERFYDNVMASVAQMPEATQEVFIWALAKGKEYQAAGEAASNELREAYAQADLTFFSRFRGNVGGRMQRLYSIGAPLTSHLADFFETIGLPILNVYSLAEVGGFAAASRPEARRPGSCGQVNRGYEVCLAADGEVLVRSETMMSEYWGWPVDMGQLLDEAGWLHTGDLGHFDDDGYLYLTGRKQPALVLSTGRKIMPTPIEQALMASPYITQAVVFGEGHPYVTALIVPDLTRLAEQFQLDAPANGRPDESDPDSNLVHWFWQPDHEEDEPLTTTAHPSVKMLLDKVITGVNEGLDRWEQIKRYALLEQAYSPAATELAEMMPAGRHHIAVKYAAQIEAMYPRTAELSATEITQVQVNPERMRQLLEKESILDAWLADAGIHFLFDLARDKQIDVPSMVHICDTAAAIAQMESEEKPLSTAFIVGNPSRIARILPPSEIRLLRSDYIRRMHSNLVTLAPLVDGLTLGYIVDRHGFVRDIRRLRLDQPDLLDEVAADPVNTLLGPQFRQRALISQLCDAVVFFVPVGGRQVRVFADGQLVGRYSNGDWSPDRMNQANENLDQWAQEKHYDPALVRRILRCAFQMSEENLGAIFIIGDADLIMEHSDAPEISHLALIVSADLSELSNQELINFAKQDGATVIDADGRFRGCTVLLRPGAETAADIGPGNGARHSSAAKMSAEANCLAITVSQDGPITIYDSGRRVLSL